MIEHTAEDYGRLLLEYLNKAGVHVVLSLESFKHGGRWQGGMRIPRQQLSNDYGSKQQMNGEAYISVSDLGDVRLHYSEQIVFDLEKKARSDERKAAEQAEEEARLNDMPPAVEEEFFEESDFDFDYDFDSGENEAEYVSEAPEDIEPAEEEDEDETLCEEEDDEHISERRRLQVLEQLQVANSRFYIHGRSNETRLYHSASREMDSCSRISAKKAAQWICDELLCACYEIERLANDLEFHRVPAEDKQEEWYDEWLTDTFDHIETIAGIRSKEYEIEESAQKQARLEDLLTGCEENEESDEELTPMVRFRKMAADAFRLELQGERKRQEQIQKEIDELKKELAEKK